MYTQWSEQCLGVDSLSTMFLEIVRSSGRKCAYLAQALGGMFIITVAAVQSDCFVFFKAGILVIFLKVSLNIHAEIFVIGHYILCILVQFGV